MNRNFYFIVNESKTTIVRSYLGTGEYFICINPDHPTFNHYYYDLKVDSEFNNVKPLDWKIRKSGLLKRLDCKLTLTDKKKVKSVSTSGDIARQQPVKLGLSVQWTVKLCGCISTALHSSKYTNFLDGMKVVESCTAWNHIPTWLRYIV